MVCPICGAEVKPDERLVIHWYDPRNWWVVDHYKPMTDEMKARGRVVAYIDITTTGEFVGWCGRANYNLKTGEFNV